MNIDSEQRPISDLSLHSGANRAHADIIGILRQNSDCAEGLEGCLSTRPAHDHESATTRHIGTNLGTNRGCVDEKVVVDRVVLATELRFLGTGFELHVLVRVGEADFASQMSIHVVAKGETEVVTI